MREEGVGLEHEPEIAAVHGSARDVVAAEHDPAGVRLDQAGDHPQDRRLAAAARAEKRDELPVVDAKADPVDRYEISIGLAQIPELEVSRSRAAQRTISRPQRSVHLGRFFASAAVSGKYMLSTIFS